MNLENPTTCEECLSLLTGIIIPKPANPKEQNFGYVLKTEDAKILKSIAKQLSKKIGLTDRQYALVKRKLITYKDQFKTNDVDVGYCIDNLHYPLRDIDRSHWLKIMTYKDEDMLGIRFPFSKKIIDRIQDLQTLQQVPNNSRPGYKDHTHYFAFTPKNLFALVNIAKRFEEKFRIHKEILDLYEQCLVYEKEADTHVPGVYNYDVKNLPDEGIRILEEDVGGACNDNTMALYYDRRHLYGLKKFNKEKVESSIALKNDLTQRIIKRDSGTVLIPNGKYRFENIIQSLIELNRFPLLIVLNPKDAENDLVTTYQSLRNVVNQEDVSVMFRLPGDSDFNFYVQKHKLNNKVAKNTKVVYINSNKLPKPLLKADFNAKTVLTVGSKGLNFNNVTQYTQQFDLQIIYEDSTSNTYWSRSEKELFNAID